VNTESAAYAYITSRELVIMRGDQVVGRLSRVFDEAAPDQNKVVWTHSGDYVALLSGTTLLQEDSSDEELIVISARTGNVRRTPCPRCWDLTPIDRDAILVAAYRGDNDARDEFLKFDLDSPGAGLPVNLDPPSTSHFRRSFLISTQHFILTHQGAFFGTGDYRQQLKLTKVDGSSSVDFGYFRSNDSMLAAVIENGEEGDARIAVAFRPNPGECIAEFPTFILSPRGEEIATDMSGAQPPGDVSHVNGGMELRDLWWGLDGHLRATIASWTCDNTKRAEDEKKIPATPSTVWRLDGQKWIKEGPSHATMVRELDERTRVMLVIPDCIGATTHPSPAIYCNSGVLYRDQDEKRTRIAEQVISISMPPPYRP
jgi:hypothetical protein